MMDTRDEKYNLILEKLRDKKPNLSDPETLTEKIMSSVTKQQPGRVAKAIIMIRPWVSAAAVFLLGLFAYLNTDVPMEEKNTPTIAKVNERPEIIDCFEEIKIDQIDRMTLLRSYLCYQRQSEQKSKNTEQLIMKYLQKF